MFFSFNLQIVNANIFFFFLLNYVINENEFNGVYKIKSILNGNNILICNDILTLCNETSSFFNIINKESIFFLEE